MGSLFVQVCQNDVLPLTSDSKRLQRHSVPLDKEDVHQCSWHSGAADEVPRPPPDFQLFFVCKIGLLLK